ncbi:MAG: ComEC/Rec2 family competence protein, partial [Minisyncoccia bacterium]
KNELHYFAQENIEIPLVGNIVQKPEIKGQQQELVVDVKGLITGGTIEPVKTRMLVKTYDTKIYHYGEKIKFTTTPQIPESFVGDTDRVFDYEHFLEKDSIYYTGKSADITIIENARTSVLGSLYSLKSALIKKMYEYIPRPESSLLIGVLLGEKTALGDKLENDFRTTGLMHIVVLSGYNVSLVIFAVMLLLRFLPLYTRSVIAILGIIGFALLVGAGPTVIRASIMALFIVLGQMVGRQYHVERALVIAGLLMVLYNPWILFFDISFQFSFLATYGLIVLSPYLEKFFSRVPKKLLLQESAVATTAAQIMVAPLILYYIGDFSIISIVVNMLVLFMVPVSMLLGFLMAVFGFIFPPLASLLAVPTLYSLKYILFIVDVFADIPFAKITFPKFSFLWVLVWYGLVFIFVRRGSKKSVLPK